MNITSYPTMLLVYFLLFCSLTFPYWGKGEVIAPHRQFIELAAHDKTGAGQIENRKFSDFTHVYIPKILEHLKGSRSGWLTLWTDKNELGRPMGQITGFSPAYLPSWLIARFTDSPWRFITIQSLLTCLLTGIFIILFCREINLHPFAGLIAGTSIATSPLFMYWLTFPMFSATRCWAAGAIWAVTRLARKPDFMGWCILAFSIYSLLMTGYPQLVIFHSYILAGYGLYLIYRKKQTEVSETGGFLALSATALIAGAALALPVYIDVANTAAESARIAPDPSFFMNALPKLNSLEQVVRFVLFRTIPELFGNPVASTVPFSSYGLSFTPLVMFFAVIGLIVCFKQTWGWWLAIVILFLLAFIHPLYMFGIRYLGFNLSRSSPLGSILLPLTVIVAYGADALIKRHDRGELSHVVVGATFCFLVIIAIGLGFGFTHQVTIHWDMALVMLSLAGLFAAQFQKTRPILLVAALIMVLVTISYPLMLRQDPAQIAQTSPLVEKMSANLVPGSRFAISAPGLMVLPPNLNAGVGLASVHSYNSLSSRRYHTLIRALGGEVQTYGRWNSTIFPDYDSTMFWMSNIALMLSPMKLTHNNLKYLGEESGIFLYTVVSRMGDSIQIPLSQISVTADGLRVTDPRLLTGNAPSRILDQGDVQEFEVKRGTPSVLIVSQIFHCDWQAQVFVQSSWLSAKSTVVNDVFQGVLLPRDTEKVRLEFKPYVRYSWVAHIFWLLLLALLGITVWKRESTVKARKEC